MAKKNSKKIKEGTTEEEKSGVHPEIKKTVWVIVFLGAAIVFILAAAGQAGPLGNSFYALFKKLFGVGYYLLPTTSFVLAFSFVSPEGRRLVGLTAIAAVFFVLSSLGFIDIISPGNGGFTGSIVGALEAPFGAVASVVIMLATAIGSFLVVLNRPIKLSFWKRGDAGGANKVSGDEKIEVKMPLEPAQPGEIKSGAVKKEEAHTRDTKDEEIKIDNPRAIKNYVAPPLSLLASSVEKPTIGDLRANANIIKRTLESFGISVEMGEINVGPTVTRYTLKPAEGMKLSRITALNQDLALALAAHPIRIEAPIPGRSLVGVEVPNKAAAVVRLGSLLLYPEFQKSGPLTFILGRNVSGEPVPTNIDRMPHLLVAGATGSGKSIMIHSILISLLYKNSPEMLRLILMDPKRVELSIYENIPHLMTPVITDNKKAIGVLRWAIAEMERRYELLLGAGARDIQGYNNKSSEKIPYLIIVIDELADLMASFGREVEGSIIRLAQMARATGIHLIVSTQRPSVEVITGLIKANITSRIALQVASQVDSRTILDASGAEKLLGSGDLLFTSAEISKPLRIQGSYITEDEIKKVVSFVKKNNNRPEEEGVENLEKGGTPEMETDLEEYTGSGDDDELCEEAIKLVRSAKKASASLLQRRLKVGYARAARLLDMMEERGMIGPGEGAKPREVYLNE